MPDNERHRIIPSDRIKTIAAIDTDCEEGRVLNMRFEILQDVQDFDLMEAIRLACKDYVKNTKDGWKSWVNQGEDFDWNAFWREVPPNLCESHGFRKLDIVVIDARVDLHSSLVTPVDLCLNNAQITEIVNYHIKQGNLACIDFLREWLRISGEIPYYNYADQYRDLLEKSIRNHADDQEVWSYYMEFLAPGE